MSILWFVNLSTRLFCSLSYPLFFFEKFKASNICYIISLFPFHISCIQFSRYIWWAWEDSNLRPHAYQACALTTWATSPNVFVRHSQTLVEISGIEPLTPCLQSRCSPSWAIPPYYWVNSLFLRAFKIKQQQSKLDLTLDVRLTYFIQSFLHRKEVIQPHLPIRLPCYDFTPIIDSTFDCCL